jgi:hypothetical protein
MFSGYCVCAVPFAAENCFEQVFGRMAVGYDLRPNRAVYAAGELLDKNFVYLNARAFPFGRTG